MATTPTGAASARSRASAPALALLALGAITAAAGCGGVESDATISLELSITPTPPRVGPVTVEARLQDEAGRPLEGAAVEIEATMSHAGMVPIFASADETAPGHYTAELELTMGGDWVLLVRAVDARGRRHDWQRDVPAVAPRVDGG